MDRTAWCHVCECHENIEHACLFKCDSCDKMRTSDNLTDVDIAGYIYLICFACVNKLHEQFMKA